MGRAKNLYASMWLMDSQLVTFDSSRPNVKMMRKLNGQLSHSQQHQPRDLLGAAIPSCFIFR